MLYRFIAKSYSRKSDVLTLAAILRGFYPFRVEKRGSKWAFTAIVAEADYKTIARCL